MSTSFSNPYAPVTEISSRLGNRFPLAGLDKRFLGAVADGLISAVAIMPGFVLIFVGMAQQTPGAQAPELGMLGIAGFAWLVLGVLALAGLQIYLLVTRSQTIGKYLVKTQIVDHESGEPAGFLHSFVLRSFVSGLIGGIPFVGVVYSIADILFIFRADRRCLHDLIASTSVVDIS